MTVNKKEPVLRMDCFLLPALINSYLLVVCAGSSVSGYDDTSSDNSTANAADSSATSPEPSAAPGSSPAAAGPHVTAGNVHSCYQ